VLILGKSSLPAGSPRSCLSQHSGSLPIPAETCCTCSLHCALAAGCPSWCICRVQDVDIGFDALSKSQASLCMLLLTQDTYHTAPLTRTAGKRARLLTPDAARPAGRCHQQSPRQNSVLPAPRRSSHSNETWAGSRWGLRVQDTGLCCWPCMWPHTWPLNLLQSPDM
jgi:hypothetical protein